MRTEITRIWEMPNSKTFKVKCIKDFIIDNLPKNKNLLIIDPFANEHSIQKYFDESPISS